MGAKGAFVNFDVETDTDQGVDKVSVVHCLVIRDVRTRKIIASCTDDEKRPEGRYLSIKEGLKILSRSAVISGHNIITYDLPVLLRLYNWSPGPDMRILDTQVMSQSLFAHMAEYDYGRFHKKQFPGGLIGNHSVKAWGYRLKCHKGGFEGPWGTWTQDMHDYCEQDTNVQVRIVRFFLKVSHYHKESMASEHRLAQHLYWGRRAGIPFDTDAAQKLYSELAAEREEIKERMQGLYGWWWKPKKGAATKQSTWKNRFIPKKDAPYIRSDTRKVHGRGYVTGAPCTQIEQCYFNPGSRQHIARVLKREYKWKPEKFTDGGAPEISEQTMKPLEHLEHVPILLRFLLLQKRVGSLAEGPKAWLKFVEDDGRVHTRILATGAQTHRGSHSNFNITQVPSVDHEYGKECRALFHAPKGWRLVGSDVSGLESVMMAHFMHRWDGGEYTKIIVDTGDVHTFHVERMGGSVPRPSMKTWFYAYIYGAGDEKLGLILNPRLPMERRKALGKASRNRFEKGIRALGFLITDTKRQSSEKGHIDLIDGRRAYTRSDHSATNTLLQGGGAVICKYWLNDLFQHLVNAYGPPVGAYQTIEEGWKKAQWSMALWAHDEVQIFTRTAIAEDVGKAAVQCIEKQTERFKLLCPVTGDFKVGINWAQTH